MKSFSFGLLALLLGCIGLTACTSQPDAPESVRIRWATDPQTLDPLLATAPQAIEVINLLHGSLLVGDYQSQRYVPWLAQSLPVVSRRDSLTLLTYTLRPEATWDNGQPVVARDVAFTLKVLNCPGLPTEYMRAQYGFVLDIELDASNARRFTLVCQSASQDIIGSSGDYLILPEYSLDPQGTLRPVPLPLLRTDTLAAVQRYPALRALAHRYRTSPPNKLPGCGPYTLTAWAKNRYLRLQRKSKWWARNVRNAPRWLQANAPQLDFRIIPDDATALLALRRGSIDLYPMPTAREFNRLRHSADTANLFFRVADSYDMTVVGFNTQRPALQNALTRRALSMLFDIPGLVQATQQGLAYRSVSLINPHDKLAYNDSLPLPAFNPKAAAGLLQQAGWRRQPNGTWWQDGKQLALGVSYKAEDSGHEIIALQFQAAAKKLGILVKAQPRNSELLKKRLRKGEIDMYVRTMHGNPFSYNFKPILHSKGIGILNYTHFQNAEGDRLIDAISVEQNTMRKAKLLRRFQTLLQQESPLVVLYFARHRLIASRRLSPTVQATSIQPGYDALQLKPNSSSRR
ncbi:ABC transporter substrate-binding protein [Hymenobacter sp. BT186]|uniref:ABC transporter substrate-binding protein n=1 Tax=Hymenobacter telluris TaxID=2816474 RepID=A0A939F1D0_9BACT|nr:ABC transporter substrate-binding protein [Hymenobacter telluris]MBO0360946.1 ABC transporter substrate-binding protein [Hymenobacter telluris]MBW3376974.1 ABC transporter substrate-binding protein [Hymenobacter norwichensis]